MYDLFSSGCFSSKVTYKLNQIHFIKGGEQGKWCSPIPTDKLRALGIEPSTFEVVGGGGGGVEHSHPYSTLPPMGGW